MNHDTTVPSICQIVTMNHNNENQIEQLWVIGAKYKFMIY